VSVRIPSLRGAKAKEGTIFRFHRFRPRELPAASRTEIKRQDSRNQGEM